MLRRVWFGPKWLSWMEVGVFNSTMCVIINGSPTKDFVIGRGLRQGDPLSPFLLEIVVEGMIRRESEYGYFKGFKVNDMVSYNILKFSKDTILVGTKIGIIYGQ